MRPRDNPFNRRVVTSLKYIFPLDTTREVFFSSLADPNGLIVGPMGSGKTLLLQEIEAYFESVGQTTRLLFLNEDNRAEIRAFVR